MSTILIRVGLLLNFVCSSIVIWFSWTLSHWPETLGSSSSLSTSSTSPAANSLQFHTILGPNLCLGSESVFSFPPAEINIFKNANTCPLSLAAAILAGVFVVWDIVLTIRKWKILVEFTSYSLCCHFGQDIPPSQKTCWSVNSSQFGSLSCENFWHQSAPKVISGRSNNHSADSVQCALNYLSRYWQCLEYPTGCSGGEWSPSHLPSFFWPAIFVCQYCQNDNHRHHDHYQNHHHHNHHIIIPTKNIKSGLQVKPDNQMEFHRKL